MILRYVGIAKTIPASSQLIVIHFRLQNLNSTTLAMAVMADIKYNTINTQ